MARKHANTLTDRRLKTLLEEVTASNPQPTAMTAAFALSFYAGLRVQEIAGLDWRLNVLNADGTFRSDDFPIYDMHGNAVKDAHGDVLTRPMESLFIGSNIGKYGKSRSIPLHRDVNAALRKLFDESRGSNEFPACPFVIPSAKTGASQALTPRAHALKMRLNRIYLGLGLAGCTSHSGRRSFITRAATKANAFDMSLRDVQVLAGHRNLTTTQAYIDISDRHGDLVNALWK